MNLLIQLPILLFSVILHEYAHGWVAARRGDDTARLMGRLTLNPLPHIDLFGTILLPALSLMTGAPLFGWAKPVPVDPYRLHNPDRDMVWVSLAGPLSNVLLAVTAAFGMWLLRLTGAGADSIGGALYVLLQVTLFINVILPVFNLLPIPPLDGSKVLVGLLPSRAAASYLRFEPYGFYVIILLLASGFFWRLLGPVVAFVIYHLGGAL